MTRKVYKSAMGKEIDLGALLLRNEQVRAVGNMNVNARGDVLDSANRVIDAKNRQVQRQYQRTTNVSAELPVQSSVKPPKQPEVTLAEDPAIDTIDGLDVAEAVATAEPTAIEPAPVADDPSVPATGGGLAAAIARSRLIKQEKEKTLREKQQSQGLRKI